MNASFGLMLLLSIPCLADGKLAYFSGTVSIERDGKSAAGIQGQTLLAGTKVKTGSESVAILSLDGGSHLKMNADSELMLEQISGTESQSVFLQSGGVFSQVGRQKAKHFSVHTKSATMGVRGTRFFTAYGKEQDVWMCVEDGEVAVESKTQDAPVLVEKGQGVFIPTGKKVTAPKAYSWTKGLNWNMDPAQGEVKGHSSIESGYRDLTDQNYD